MLFKITFLASLLIVIDFRVIRVVENYSMNFFL